ncbi:g protein-coupled receptor [Anaeramoeba ignava]|uniref:G protein-coupled receptor n=1 Tax=Anaeramoeba ignava TaxID=1746090 RepID=A0A9Q0L8Y1_ANAIG|nr:g protein-coupled receptor [Anaeramoeba ignava]
MAFYIFFPDLLGATLGSIGALVIIFVHFKFRDLRTFYRKLIFILSIYDLITALVYTLPGHYVHAICVFQPIVISFFIPTAAYWAAVISIITSLKITKNISEETLDKLQKIAHLILWLISGTIAIIFAVFSTPQPHARIYWCWVKEIYLTKLLYFVWWAYLLISLLFYIYTIIKIRKVFQEVAHLKNFLLKKQTRKNLRTQLRMSMIPLVYILIVIPTSVKRGKEMFEKDTKDIPFLDFLQALFLSTQGFFDCLIFVIGVRRVRQRLFSLCSSKPSKEDDESQPLVWVAEEDDENKNESLESEDDLGLQEVQTNK